MWAGMWENIYSPSKLMIYDLFLSGHWFLIIILLHILSPSGHRTPIDLSIYSHTLSIQLPILFSNLC